MVRKRTEASFLVDKILMLEYRLRKKQPAIARQITKLVQQWNRETMERRQRESSGNR